MNPEADLSDLDGDATPENWLCSSCGMHDNNNILKKFLKNLSEEMTVIGKSDFDYEMKKIQDCINSADSRKVRTDPECAKSLNDLLTETEVTEDHKLQIARLKYSDLDKKTNDEKTSILEQITRFPAIKPTFQIRFRSMKSGLQNILAAKAVIQQSALITSPHQELLKSGDLDWNIVECLYSIFSAVSEKTDMFESLTATSGQQIQSYFDLIAMTLVKTKPTTPR